MHGSQLFQKFKPVLQLLASVFSVLPQFLNHWFWRVSNVFPGILGVSFRWVLATAMAKSIGDNVYFGHNVTVKHWKNLAIGKNVSIHENAFIDALGGIEIGDNVSIAHASSLISFDHGIEAEILLKYADLIPEKIVIEDDVWVGAGVRILKGAHISRRVVVAANSVVKGQLESHTIYGGVPARKIKSIP